MRGLARAWRNERAFTFSLYMSFVVVTFGGALLATLLWAFSGMGAGLALREAARDAAYAGQAQIGPSQTPDSVYTASQTDRPSASLDAQAQTLWQQAVTDLHLHTVFTGLSMQVHVQGSQVIVTATGDYQPVLLGPVVRHLLPKGALVVPMTVTVAQDIPQG